MYGTRQHAGRRARALTLLNGYVEQLMSECEDGAVENLEEMQLSGGIADNELDRIAGEFTLISIHFYDAPTSYIHVNVKLTNCS
jgi:hypothetical protein